MPQSAIHCSENIINMLIKSQEDLLAPRDPPSLQINLTHIAPLTYAYMPHEL